MTLIVKEKAGSHIEPIAPGVHIGICYGLIDLGTQENKVYKGEAHKVLIQWELPDCCGEFERDGEKVSLPRVISRMYTLSLSEKANLRKALESWRGQKFTADELKGFDLKDLLGTPCQLQIVQETKEGRIFANIAAIMALPKGTPNPGKPENEIVLFSLEESGGKSELPSVPEWVQNIITESKEWQRLTTSVPAPDLETDEDDNIPF